MMSWVGIVSDLREPPLHLLEAKRVGVATPKPIGMGMSTLSTNVRAAAR